MIEYLRHSHFVLFVFFFYNLIDEVSTLMMAIVIAGSALSSVYHCFEHLLIGYYIENTNLYSVLTQSLVDTK